MEETSGENYPDGEIDLMKYYNGNKSMDFYDRCIINKNDILGLLWLTKLELK